jgi:hypothetical protein
MVGKIYPVSATSGPVACRRTKQYSLIPDVAEVKELACKECVSTTGVAVSATISLSSRTDTAASSNFSDILVVSQVATPG